MESGPIRQEPEFRRTMGFSIWTGLDRKTEKKHVPEAKRKAGLWCCHRWATVHPSRRWLVGELCSIWFEKAHGQWMKYLASQGLAKMQWETGGDRMFWPRHWNCTSWECSVDRDQRRQRPGPGPARRLWQPLEAAGHMASARVKVIWGAWWEDKKLCGRESAIPGAWIDKGEEGSETWTISQ